MRLEVSSPITLHQNGLDKHKIIQESTRTMIHIKRMPSQFCAEIVAARKNCSQNIWSKQMLPEYNVTQDVVTLWCDNLKTFNISLNPIDFEEKKSFELEHSFSKLQLTDSSTKALVGNKLENLRGRLGIHQHEKL